MINVTSHGSCHKQIVDIQEWWNAVEGGSHIVTHDFYPDGDKIAYRLIVESGYCDDCDDEEEEADSPVDVYEVKDRNDALGLLQLHKEELMAALNAIEELEKMVKERELKIT